MSDIAFVKGVIAQIKQDKGRPTKAQINNILDQVAELAEAHDVAQDGLNHARELLTQKAEQLTAAERRVADLQTELTECVRRHSECFEMLVDKERRLRVWKESYEVLEERGKVIITRLHERLAAAENDFNVVRNAHDKIVGELIDCQKERDELIELLDHTLSYTCCAAYSPSLTQEINAYLEKVGVGKTA